MDKQYQRVVYGEGRTPIYHWKRTDEENFIAIAEAIASLQGNEYRKSRKFRGHRKFNFIKRIIYWLIEYSNTPNAIKCRINGHM